ncbi:unnamed protein product [Boreogadus saida]
MRFFTGEATWLRLIVLDLIEPLEPDDGNLREEAASPVNAPAEKRSKLACHRELLRLETERCMLDIENAHLKVLLLQKEVLSLQKQKLLDICEPQLICN